MVRDGAGGPSHTVLSVKLGRQRPPCETAIEVILHEPGCILPVAVKAQARTNMASEVVNGPEAVIGAPRLASHERMQSVGFRGCGTHLEEVVSANRANHLAIRGVRKRVAGEHHPNSARSRRLAEESEQSVRLDLELHVRGDHDRVARRAARGKELRRHFPRQYRINPPLGDFSRPTRSADHKP